MPVVLVIAAARPSGIYDRVARAISASVSTALGLPVDAVYTTFLLAGPAYRGGQAVEPWPIALLHGRAREAASMERAADAVSSILASHWDADLAQVHVQWVNPD